MPASEGVMPRFNDSSVPRTAWDLDWRSPRITVGNASAGIQKQSRPPLKCNLSGLFLNEPQKDYFLWLRFYTRGQVRPFLMRCGLKDEMGTVLERDGDGNPSLIEPVVLGTGDGTPQDFQLKSVFANPDFPGEDFEFIIRHPHIDYPTQDSLVRNIDGSYAPWEPMDELQIYADGVPLSRIQWSVNKETGIVTTSATGEIGATGGFYIVCAMSNSAPVTNPGGGAYQVDSGEIFELPGEL